MIRVLYFLIAFSILCPFPGCIEAESEFSKLAPGIWRGTLKLEDTPVFREEDDESPIIKDEVLLPFNFEVIYTSKDTFHIVLHNGEERIKVTDIKYGTDRAMAKDTVLINFPVFDTYLKAIFVENVMEGEWVVNYRENYSIPFVAYHGQGHRYLYDGVAPAENLSGKWKTEFEINTPDAYPAIGEFEQTDEKLTGTFRTETGDYRYLDGIVRENKFSMSCFDGAHAFLFDGKIMEDKSLLGTFYSGNHYKVLFESVKDDNYDIESPFSITKDMTSGEPLSFSFPNTEGIKVSLNDDQYAGKPKIIQLMGTWCPNCKDETLFLMDYLDDSSNPDIDIISICFERYREEDKSMAAIERFKLTFDVPYEVLYGGYHDKAEASKQLPQINKITSYPTLLFLDKENKIRRIHTGFNGPATSEFESFKTAFDSTVKELIGK